MKKIIVAAMSALLALAAFTACTYKADFSQEEVKEDDNYGIIYGDKTVEFKDCILKDAYCGTYEEEAVKNEGGVTIVDIDEDGCALFTAGDWDSFTIALEEPIDLSEAEKITIRAKFVGEYTAGDAIVFEISDGSKAIGVNSWGYPEFMKLAAANQNFEITLDKFDDMGDNSKFEGGKLEDLTMVTSFLINPRGAKGVISVKSIIIE